jgi:hypothetical protein
LDSVTTPETTTTKPSPGCALSASGLSAPEIAELLHYEPVTVRWPAEHPRLMLIEGAKYSPQDNPAAPWTSPWLPRSF